MRRRGATVCVLEEKLAERLKEALQTADHAELVLRDDSSRILQRRRFEDYPSNESIWRLLGTSGRAE